jgi:exonuclease-1
MALLRDGKRSEAIDCFQRSLDVTPEMAHKLMRSCRKAGVEVIVAPYEADPQLAHLANTGYVDAVITEDSDILVYQCRR